MDRRPIPVDVREEPITALDEYARIPISFDVRRILDLESTEDFGGFRLVERVIDVPYEKDYDALDGADPVDLATRFDLTNWAVLAARSGGRRVGGVIVAFDTPEVVILEGRRDLSVLWDVRVSPEHRGRGVGTALFRAAESWASERGCLELKVETQNVNVPACRFYARQGCVLGGINRFAYPGRPGEIQLLWYKDLSPRGRSDPPASERMRGGPRGG
jgi:GNAT superfamily N-acetyltransferase